MPDEYENFVIFVFVSLLFTVGVVPDELLSIWTIAFIVYMGFYIDYINNWNNRRLIFPRPLPFQRRNQLNRRDMAAAGG